MARSYRKTPIFGNTTSPSEKDDKKNYHSRYRQAERQAIIHDKEIFPSKHDVYNIWRAPKDGKSYRGPNSRFPWLSDAFRMNK